MLPSSRQQWSIAPLVSGGWGGGENPPFWPPSWPCANTCSFDVAQKALQTDAELCFTAVWRVGWNESLILPRLHAGSDSPPGKPPVFCHEALQNLLDNIGHFWNLSQWLGKNVKFSSALPEWFFFRCLISLQGFIASLENTHILGTFTAFGLLMLV